MLMVNKSLLIFPLLSAFTIIKDKMKKAMGKDLHDCRRKGIGQAVFFLLQGWHRDCLNTEN